MDVEKLFSYTYNITSRYIYAALFATCAIVTLSGNLISILVFCKQTMRSNSNRFLTSLAVSDLLVGGICVHLCLHHIITEMFANPNTGKREYIAMSICANSSMLTLACIAYDRYCKLFPESYDLRISDLKTKWMIALSWILAIFSQLFQIVNYMITFTLQITVVFFVTSVIAFCYRKITLKIKSDAVTLNHSTQDENTKVLRLQKSKKLARRLKILVSVYSACFIPIAITVIFTVIAENLLNIDSKSLILQHFNMVSVFAIALDSALNPLLHLSTNAKMRKLAKKMLSFNGQNRIES